MSCWLTLTDTILAGSRLKVVFLSGAINTNPGNNTKKRIVRHLVVGRTSQLYVRPGVMPKRVPAYTVIM